MTTIIKRFTKDKAGRSPQIESLLRKFAKEQKCTDLLPSCELIFSKDAYEAFHKAVTGQSFFSSASGGMLSGYQLPGFGEILIRINAEYPKHVVECKHIANGVVLGAGAPRRLPIARRYSRAG